MHEETGRDELEELVRRLHRDLTDLLLLLERLHKSPPRAVPAAPPRLLSVHECARALQVSDGCVRDLIRRGDLGGIRAGRLLRIPPRALQDFVEGNGGASAPNETQESKNLLTFSAEGGR